MKCPKKHVKEDFVMWKHFLNFLKCPKIEEFHFRFIFCFEIDHVLIFWNAPLFYVRIFWNAPFFLSDSENSTWSILKQKMNRKWNSSILGHFKKLRKCYHMTKSSITCFLGHFMIPRVLSRNFCVTFWTDFFRKFFDPNSHVQSFECNFLSNLRQSQSFQAEKESSEGKITWQYFEH